MSFQNIKMVYLHLNNVFYITFTKLFYRYFKTILRKPQNIPRNCKYDQYSLANIPYSQSARKYRCWIKTGSTDTYWKHNIIKTTLQRFQKLKNIVLKLLKCSWYNICYDVVKYNLNINTHWYHINGSKSPILVTHGKTINYHLIN